VTALTLTLVGAVPVNSAFVEVMLLQLAEEDPLSQPLPPLLHVPALPPFQV
jgi:hypothetical protein